MSNPVRPHDVVAFMKDATQRMASDYEKIRSRAIEDPGTAGDRGEENWKRLLQDWLPGHYHVVTKGRILNAVGEASRQFDVLVLKESYPKAMLNEKMYLAAGIVAAFECKTTLEPDHIRDAVKRFAQLHQLYRRDKNTPRGELCSPVIAGLLAHSHDWKGLSSKPALHISQKLNSADADLVDHPHNMLDLLCVADVGTWCSVKMTSTPMDQLTCSDQPTPLTGHEHYSSSPGQVESFTPIGALITRLWRKLAWNDPGLRPFAEYFSTAQVSSGEEIELRQWPFTVFSNKVAQELAIRFKSGVGAGRWNEWLGEFD